MGRINEWIVEDMVRALEGDRDTCIVLNASMMPKTGTPRVIRDGKRWTLSRYLYYRVTGTDPREAMLSICPIEGCLNPFHRELSMRRSRAHLKGCPNGHDYTPENTLRHGRYRCKQCYLDRLARKRKGAYGNGYCRSKGHRLTKANTYNYTTKDGRQQRRCRTCALDNQRLYRERKKAK